MAVSTPNIDELRGLANALLALLEDPHPGLHTWRMALANVLRRIDEFHPDGPRPPLERWITRFEAWCKEDTENGTDMICEVLDEMRAARCPMSERITCPDCGKKNVRPIHWCNPKRRRIAVGAT